MARARNISMSEGLNKAPHSVSLKVLRLTRPSLTQTYVHPHTTSGPKSHGLEISALASLPYPSADPSNPFILSPALTLPESFQSAYVGESFSCTICANNEIPTTDNRRRVETVKIQAEIQSPSQPTGLPVDFEKDDKATLEKNDELEPDFLPGASLQRTLRINLQEEGNHVLAITVTYTEILSNTPAGFHQDSHDAESPTTSPKPTSRTRTFRKLYQFIAQNLIGVRTKAGDFFSTPSTNGKKSCTIEAQLENLGEAGHVISIEGVSLAVRRPFGSQSLNWDVYGPSPGQEDPVHAPVLNPRDVLQVAFLVTEGEGEDEGPIKGGDAEKEEDGLKVPEGKVALGQLSIRWRGAMGERGSLSTGWLLGRV